MKKTAAILYAALTLCFIPCARASMISGWGISSSYVWRLLEDPDYNFTKGTPAKILKQDRNIMHRHAIFKVDESLLKRYTFKVGCMYQSSTPAFELDVSSLDIGIKEQSRGYVFARFLVDKGQEYSLRGEVMPPSRIVFTPLTKIQEKKLNDLFLQLSEGGELTMAILQGENGIPRVYKIPLTGFFDISKIVLEDCKTLSKLVKDHRGKVTLLPDYTSIEPKDAAPKDYSLKPKKEGSDGLDNSQNEPKDEAPKPEPPKAEPPKTEEPKTDEAESDNEKPPVQLFTPGGAAASIGEDGKPITEEGKDENLGTAKSMKIDENGNPIQE